MAKQKWGMFPVAVANRIYINAGGGSSREQKEFTQPRGGRGGGDAKLAVTPSGGIAAMTTDAAPYTFPSATCDLVNEVTGALTGSTETVYNMVMIAINGDSLIQLKKIGSRYFVDVDNCPVTPSDPAEFYIPDGYDPSGYILGGYFA